MSRKYSKSFSHAELSQPQIINIPKIFKDFFAGRVVLAANHQYPENAQSLFRLQNCFSSKSSISRKYSKTYWPAELSQPHVICMPNLFNDFFACRSVLAGSHRFHDIFQDFVAGRVVLAAKHQYRESTQSLFRMQNCLSGKSSISRKYSKTFCPQNCLSRKSSISRKYSRTFSPAELSQPQIINIPKMLKVFFACRIVLAANHQHPENAQSLFRMQNCLSRKSSKSRKYSKTYWPAELSQPHVICIPNIFKIFFACRSVLAGSHRFHDIFQDFFAGRVVLAPKHQYRESTQSLFRMQSCLSGKSSISRKYSKTFCPQNCLSRKSSISRKYSKTFSPAELSQPQIINIPKMLKVFFACRIVLAANHQHPENAQSLFRMQNCLSRKSSKSRKYSKTYWPAELSQPHVIYIPNIFKIFFACRSVLAGSHRFHDIFQDFFAGRVVLAAKDQYRESTQSLFRMQNCLSRKSSISRKYSKTFRPQNCLSRKSSISRKYSKTFSLAELSQPQIINIPKMLKVFFAFRIVLAANHQYPENAQSLFRMQNCLSRKSSKSRKYSKTYWPAELSQPHVICIPNIFKDFFACRSVLAGSHRFHEIFKDFFAGRVVLAANNQYPENAQSLFRLENCLSSKSLISRKYSKSFLACRIVLATNHQNPGSIQRLIGLLNCLIPMSSVYRKCSKTSLPAELSQQQIINIPEIFKDFFACRTVLAARKRFPEIFEDFFACRNVLAANHQCPENTRRLFACRTVLAGSHRFPEIFQDFFACRIVLAANHQNPENAQSLFRMQNCLSRKSSKSRKYSKTFSPAELSQLQVIGFPTYSKTSSPAEMS